MRDPAEETAPLVLLVEDDAVNQRITRLMLERRGYRVEVARDGDEAVRMTEGAAYAAVLMDCHMPRVDGFRATARIRERDAARPRLPILAMTANAGAGAREQCILAGMDDFVEKPFTADLLDQALRRWIPRESPPRACAPVDLAMLRSLRAPAREGDADFVAEVIAIFLDDAPRRLAAIRDAVASGDIPGAGRSAHALKGAAGHLGAGELVRACERFEASARAGAAFDAAAAIEAIAAALARVSAALAGERSDGV
jgi:CheY-like chemotaxis protein/HPt (histidine-containing phosphotransfer) domain-containing protein